MNVVELEECMDLKPQFEKRNGLLPVAVQESSTGQILMLASLNEEALKYSLQHRIAAFYSTSRGSLWVKGESSGNYLQLDEVLIDCDQDALVFKVTLKGGGVCHTFNQFGQNRKACFYRALEMESKTLQFIEK
jgi:phosphoribosyl-AMP cyclohydrolase